MDWQRLLVFYGQTILIGTGCIIGFIAVVVYRTKVRWGKK